MGSTSTPAPTSLPADPGPYANHIVHWNADTKPQKTAWLATPDLRRLYIPDGVTFGCLKARGYAGPDALSAGLLSRIPDLGGRWAACGSTMPSQRAIRRGMRMTSDDGRVKLDLQSDGNLVLRDSGDRVMWSNDRPSDMVTMQPDGNVVALRNDGVVVWSTATSRNPGARMVVQPDGNLVVYSGARAVWASHTAGRDPANYLGHIVQWGGDTKPQKTAWFVAPDWARLWIPDAVTFNCLKGSQVPGPDVVSWRVLQYLPDQRDMWAACGNTIPTLRSLRRGMASRSNDGRFALHLQPDGNLVMYGPTGSALWANYRYDTAYAIMQQDGNFVTYRSNGTPNWATGTAGAGEGTRLVLQDDGNLVAYSPVGQPVWSSRTAGRV